ncbi:hypothetical protein [Streptomyces sp. NPDC002403]
MSGTGTRELTDRPMGRSDGRHVSLQVFFSDPDSRSTYYLEKARQPSGLAR